MLGREELIDSEKRIADAHLGLHDVESMNDLVEAMDRVSLKAWFRESLGFVVLLDLVERTFSGHGVGNAVHSAVTSKTQSQRFATGKWRTANGINQIWGVA
ncbi:hypothetical protein BKA70DRAFT_1221970 [Coprinopsis sp. MPI-PUGE-AT-0042]|nr:hypothetical protein BKA70DRAFT_1221970 [Coprinopsis sp. MPI-PUGE-AT-0042]